MQEHLEDTTMKKKIDKKIIQQLMGVTVSGRISSSTAMRGITCIIFIVLVPVVFLIDKVTTGKPIFTALCFVGGCGCAYLAYRFEKLRQNARDGVYYITEDVCATKRKDKDEYEGSVTYIHYLIFRKSGCLRLNFPFSSCAPYSPEEIYEQAFAGDKFYLLWTNKHKVLYIFNERHWELDKSEFTDENGIYIPKED